MVVASCNGGWWSRRWNFSPMDVDWKNLNGIHNTDRVVGPADPGVEYGPLNFDDQILADIYAIWLGSEGAEKCGGYDLPCRPVRKDLHEAAVYHSWYNREQWGWAGSLQWRVLRSDSFNQCEANAKMEHVAASDVKGLWVRFWPASFGQSKIAQTGCIQPLQKNEAVLELECGVLIKWRPSLLVVAFFCRTDVWHYPSSLEDLNWCVFQEEISGQIIATSHDLGPQKVAQEGKIPFFQENLRWWN